MNMRLLTIFVCSISFLMPAMDFNNSNPDAVKNIIKEYLVNTNNVESAARNIKTVLNMMKLTNAFNPEQHANNTQLAIKEIARRCNVTEFTAAAYLKTKVSKQFIATCMSQKNSSTMYQAQKAMEETLQQKETKRNAAAVHILANIAAPYSMQSKFVELDSKEFVTTTEQAMINLPGSHVLIAQVQDSTLNISCVEKINSAEKIKKSSHSFVLPAQSLVVYSMAASEKGTIYLALGKEETNKVYVVALNSDFSLKADYGNNGIETLQTQRPVQFFKMAALPATAEKPFQFCIRFAS